MTNIENQQIKELSLQIEKQNSRLEAQNTRLEHHNLHVTEMKATLDTIQSALLGNPISNDGGLVKRIVEVETSVSKLTTVIAGYKSKWLGIVWLVTVSVGVLGFLYYLTSIWKNFFK